MTRMRQGRRRRSGSMYILQKTGLSVSVVQIPVGKDPDELCKASTAPLGLKKHCGRRTTRVESHSGAARHARCSVNKKESDRGYHEGLRSLGPVDANRFFRRLPSARSVPHVHRKNLYEAVKKIEDTTSRGLRRRRTPSKISQLPRHVARSVSCLRDIKRRREKQSSCSSRANFR
jgi:hypothetical protein